MKIRVTRVLVYEGDEQWVEETLARSYIQIGAATGIHFELNTPKGSIRETQRSREYLELLPPPPPPPPPLPFTR